MANILEEIIAYKKTVIADDKTRTPFSTLEKQVSEIPQVKYSFKSALTNTDFKTIKVIAEVKKASPSKGVISHNFNPLTIAEGYYANGADAISVLTDEKYFMGHNEYLRSISSAIALPCIRKDFIIDEYQILQAKALGAAAYLLIVDCLNYHNLQRLITFGTQLGLDALIETHREDEVKIALDAGAQIIGVNNRNLRTFETDITTSIKLRHLVPDSIPFVSESGISTTEDIALLLEHRTSAVLIGESLMRSGAELLKKLK